MRRGGVGDGGAKGAIGDSGEPRLAACGDSGNSMTTQPPCGSERTHIHWDATCRWPVHILHGLTHSRKGWEKAEVRAREMEKGYDSEKSILLFM